MAVDVVSDRLGELYPQGYVPVSDVLAVPEALSAWSDPCPRIDLARYPHPLPRDAPFPDVGVSLLATEPLPYTDLLQRMPARGASDWTAADSGHASAAYGVQQHLVDGEIVDDLVVLATKPTLAAVMAAMHRHRACSTVTITDGESDTALIGIRPFPDFLAPDRVTMTVTAADGGPHPPLLRALYAPALMAWRQWWRRATSSTSSAPIPWPQTLELTGPDVSRPHRIRIEHVTQTRLAQPARRQKD